MDYLNRLYEFNVIPPKGTKVSPALDLQCLTHLDA